MPYNDQQFNQDVETALRLESGFQGPIVKEAPGEIEPLHRRATGYGERQAALAKPRQMAQGQDMESILGLDRYIYAKEKANIGPERAMANWDTRLKVRQVETEAREEATEARELHEAKLVKSAAESEKALGEAAEARGKIGMPKSPTEVNIMAARERRAKRGEAGPPTGEDILGVQVEQAGDVAQQKSRTPTAGIREKAATLKTTAQGLTKLRAEHDPIFTGQEAPVGKLAKFFGGENPAFARFLSRAQAIYAPARNELIGATQSPQEIESINRLLPPDISKLSDIEAVAAMETLMDMTQMKLSNLEGQFRLEDEQAVKPQAQGKHPLAGKPAGMYRSSTGRTVKWDGTQEAQ